MLQLYSVLFEQVLFNLLDNAAKYSPPDSTVSIRSLRERDAVLLQIADEGDGIPPAELERVFVEPMHGRIAAANRTDRSGAVLTIRLPVPAGARALDTAA